MTDKSIAQKMLIKPGQQLIATFAPAGYAELFGTLPEGAKWVKSAAVADVVQLFVKDRAALEAKLPDIAKALKTGGVVWVCYPKGSSRAKSDINRDTIAAYAEAHGLNAYRVISIDDTWSALATKR